MKRKGRYTWFYVLIILLVFYISFFYMERTEISDLDVLLVVGIDREADGYRVSGLYNQNGGVDDATPMLMEGKGESFYSAYNDMVQKNLKSVSLAHTTFFIFSEAAAKNGMNQCLDYIERDQTVKMDAIIYLLKDQSVNSFMKKSIENETQFSDELNAINEKQIDQQKEVDNTINLISEKLLEGNDNLVVPYLYSEGDSIYINGYGIFREDSLIAFLDRDPSQALDFMRNRLRSYPIYLNNQVGLEVTDSQVNTTVQIVNGQLRVRFDVDFQSDIKEVSSTDHVYEEYYIKQLENEQNQYVAGKIEEVVEIMRTYQVDLLGISDAIKTTYEKDYETIMAKWEDYFSEMNLEYHIKSQTAQSYIAAV